MKETGILFTPENIRLIREGRKVQTRRVLKAEFYHRESLATIKPIDNEFLLERWPEQERMMGNFGRCDRIQCPYGGVGDKLYIKEGVIVWDGIKTPVGLVGYYMDGVRPTLRGHKRLTAMFMAKRYARTWLEITDVKVERVQDISEEDCIAEGCPKEYCLGINWYKHLWDKINGKKHPWSSNHWVFAITFKQINQPGGETK